MPINCKKPKCVLSKDETTCIKPNPYVQFISHCLKEGNSSANCKKEYYNKKDEIKNNACDYYEKNKTSGDIKTCPKPRRLVNGKCPSTFPIPKLNNHNVKCCYKDVAKKRAVIPPKKSENFYPKVPETKPEKVPLKVPETKPEKVPLKVPKTKPKKVSPKVPLKVPETKPEKVPLKVPETKPKKVPLKVPETKPEKVYQKVSPKVSSPLSSLNSSTSSFNTPEDNVRRSSNSLKTAKDKVRRSSTSSFNTPDDDVRRSSNSLKTAEDEVKTPLNPFNTPEDDVRRPLNPLKTADDDVRRPLNPFANLREEPMGKLANVQNYKGKLAPKKVTPIRKFPADKLKEIREELEKPRKLPSVTHTLSHKKKEKPVFKKKLSAPSAIIYRNKKQLDFFEALHGDDPWSIDTDNNISPFKRKVNPPIEIKYKKNEKYGWMDWIMGKNDKKYDFSPLDDKINKFVKNKKKQNVLTSEDLILLENLKKLKQVKKKRPLSETIDKSKNTSIRKTKSASANIKNQKKKPPLEFFEALHGPQWSSKKAVVKSPFNKPFPLKQRLLDDKDEEIMTKSKSFHSAPSKVPDKDINIEKPQDKRGFFGKLFNSTIKPKDMPEVPYQIKKNEKEQVKKLSASPNLKVADFRKKTPPKPKPKPKPTGFFGWFANDKNKKASINILKPHNNKIVRKVADVQMKGIPKPKGFLNWLRGNKLKPLDKNIVKKVAEIQMKAKPKPKGFLNWIIGNKDEKNAKKKDEALLKKLEKIHKRKFDMKDIKLLQKASIHSKDAKAKEKVNFNFINDYSGPAKVHYKEKKGFLDLFKFNKKRISFGDNKDKKLNKNYSYDDVKYKVKEDKVPILNEKIIKGVNKEGKVKVLPIKKVKPIKNWWEY